MMQEHNDTVVLELDRPRELRLGHKVLKRFSALRHVPLSRIQDAVDDYENLSCLFYCAMAQEDPTLTVERADELLDRVPVTQLLKKAGELMEAAFGTGEDGGEDGEADPPAAAGTGTGA